MGLLPFLHVGCCCALGPRWGWIWALSVELVGALTFIALSFTWAQKGDAHVQADHSGLTVDGLRLAKRRSIRAATVIDFRDGIRVRISRSWRRSLEVFVQGRPEAEALVAAMELGSQTSVARYLLRAGTRRENWIAAIVFAGPFLFVGFPLSTISPATLHFDPDIVVLPTGLLAAVGVVWAVRRSLRVSIGRDGIWLRSRAWGRQFFIPVAMIAGTHRRGRDLSLSLVGGSSLALSGGGAWKFGFVDVADDLEPFVAHLAELLAARPATEANPILLARGERSTGAWVAGLRALREPHAEYRRPAIPRDVLWRVVEDPLAAPTERAGSAMVLREALDGPERERLRVTAQACAAPSVRRVLQRIAETDRDVALADDQPLAEALEALG